MQFWKLKEKEERKKEHFKLKYFGLIKNCFKHHQKKSQIV